MIMHAGAESQKKELLQQRPVTDEGKINTKVVSSHSCE